LAPPMMAMRLCFFQRFVLVLFAPSIPWASLLWQTILHWQPNMTCTMQ
jgi:hypothetical protein